MSTVSPQDVLDALNQLRTNPKSYIPDLENQLKYFKGNTLYIPGEIGLMTQEGPAAVNECIQALQNQSPLPPLELCNGLCLAAADHANDIGPKGLCGHNGSNGSTMTSRIEAHGQWNGNIGENIDFGGNKSGKQIIINLIVDDGVPSRGHRTNCLSNNFKKVGIALAPHKQYKGTCVFDFAGGFTPKGSSSSYNPSANVFQVPQEQKQPINSGGFGQFQGGFGQMQMQSGGQGCQMQQMQCGGGNSNMPPGCVGMSTQTQTSISGNTKTVKTTTTYTMGDGSVKTETKTQTMTSG